MSEAFVGAVEFPDGTVVQGRGRREGLPGGIEPTFGLHLGKPQELGLPWPCAWIAWPDFWVPTDFDAAVSAITDAFQRAKEGERVEVACGGGNGRTGTVLATMAVLAGVEPTQAVAWVRANYRSRAVETPWQKRWVLRFARRVAAGGAD